MGRGGGGGGHSSGGSHSHSSSHSHGSSHSHSSSGRSSSSFSSSRPSSSYGRSSSRPSSYGGGYRPHYNPGPPRHVHYHGGSYGSYRSGGSNLLSTIIVIIMLLIIVSALFGAMRSNGGGSTITASTIQRERVDTKNAYISDCVIDEIGWIDNEKKLSSNLKYFYEKTGCQPYIVLKAYDSSMNSDIARESWSQEYYDTNFAENQNVVLYTYFCDRTDEGYGDSTLFVGVESGIVMDSEATEIFWNYLDYDWENWSVNDNDGMFLDVFKKTADKIMTVSTTTNDVKKTGLMVVMVVVIVTGGSFVIVRKFKRDKEKAQETIDILNAPLNGPKDPTEDLANKYK